MSQWVPFTHPDDFDPEILVGMYDRWLRPLPYGPTQAERMLYHTDMMELAHERRFALSQIKKDISNFEADHCWRLQDALDKLSHYYIQHRCNRHESRRVQDHPSLIGLALSEQIAVDYDPALTFDAEREERRDLGDAEAEPLLRSMDLDLLPQPTGDLGPLVRLGDSISVDENEDAEMPEAWILAARQINRVRTRSPNHPRQLGHVKVRKAYTTSKEQHCKSRKQGIGSATSTIPNA